MLPCNWLPVRFGLTLDYGPSKSKFLSPCRVRCKRPCSRLANQPTPIEERMIQIRCFRKLRVSRRLHIVLAVGASVNCCKKDGATPLFLAAQEGHLEVCAANLPKDTHLKSTVRVHLYAREDLASRLSRLKLESSESSDCQMHHCIPFGQPNHYSCKYPTLAGMALFKVLVACAWILFPNTGVASWYPQLA